MNQLSFIIDNYLQGKAIYGPVRRLFNILLSINIANFLFETIYFKYQFIDVSDYKSIINFFIKGFFIIPLLLFLGAHCAIYLIAYSIFGLSTMKKSKTWITKIVKFKLKKKDMESITRKVNKSRAGNLPLKLDRSWIEEVYILLKASVQPDQWQKAETMLNKQKQNIENNFTLLFKVIISVSIFHFYTVPHFGVWLYIVSMLVFIVFMIILWYTFLVLDVLPTIIRKIDFEFAQHFAGEASLSGQES